MRFNFRKGVLITTLVLGAVALKSWSTPREVTINFNAVASSDANPVEKAETINTFAERLVYSDALPFALQHFEEALALDPNNLKAQFYIAVLKVVETERGLGGRVIPVVGGFPLKEQRAYRKDIAQLPSGHLKYWAIQGPGDMHDENDGKIQVKNTMTAIYSLRNVLGKLRDSQGSITINMFKLKERDGITPFKIIENCPVRVVIPGVYQISACPYQKKYTATLNFADFEALRLIAGGAIAQLAPALGYNSEGALNIAKKFSGYPRVTDKMIASAAKAEPKLGVLQDVSYLRVIASMGAEAVEGYRLANRFQDQYCPNTLHQEKNRPGQLFYAGFCTNIDLTENVESASSTLKGPTQWSLHRDDLPHYNTVANALPFIDGDITDLKAQLPSGFDRCGNANALADQNMGGMFPNGDAQKAIKYTTPNFLTKSCSR